MIDNIKITVPLDDSISMLSNKAFQWTNSTDNSTCEFTSSWCKYRNLYMKLFHSAIAQRLEISGSIHKFGHGQNNTDFMLSDLKEVLQVICKDLGIDPTTATIHGLEFGVNIQTDVPPPMIFDKYIGIKKVKFKEMQDNEVGNPKATGVQSGNKKSSNVYKAYDKGLQTNLSFHLMRHEVKVQKMRYLERLGMPKPLSLSDITRPETLALLGNILIKEYDSIEKIETVCPIKEAALAGKDRQFLRVANGKEYWSDMRKDVTNGKVTQKTYTRHIKRFEQLKEQVIKDSERDVIREKIVSKWHYLSNEAEAENSENVRFAPTIQQSNYNEMSEAEKDKNVRSAPFSLRVQNGHLATTDTTENKPFLKRHCEVCKSDISHRYLSTKTCSKKCRNKLSNRVHDYTRKIPKSSVRLLFEVSYFVDMSVLAKKQRARKER